MRILKKRFNLMSTRVVFTKLIRTVALKEETNFIGINGVIVLKSYDL